ncbi:polyprenyl synthetase family protein [Micromonospora sp. NPDC049102]|uniref:polyprenyl synthetase family protein n=1 Tax=Micromonospora sp. NPDC049102 TaxID=3364265 RepID=UPI00371B4CF4
MKPARPKLLTSEFNDTVRGFLNGFLRERESTLQGLVNGLNGSAPAWSHPIMETCRNLMAGGKLLRPAFCFWGWRAAGGEPCDEDESSIIKIAAALELLHLCAIIHDDIMDESSTRRSCPSAHHQLADLHLARGWQGSSSSFGKAAAILLGDICLVWSYELILHQGLDAATRSALLEITNVGNQSLMVGQYLDLQMAARRADSSDDALLVAYFKTTSYTVERPLIVGAKVADPDSPAVPLLRRFAGHAGEAFQLRDDILGVFGDPAVTGKPVGDDLTAGKGSLLLTLARSRATRSQVHELDHARGKKELSAEHLDSCRSVIVETGALDTVEKRIADQSERASELLDSSVEVHADGKEGLRYLLKILIDRAS